MSSTDSLVPPASARQAETTHAAREYLGLVEAAFDAAHGDGGRTVSLRIAGRSVRLRFAGDTIARRILPSLAARTQEASSRADLTLLAWDGFSGPVPLPPCPWPLDDGRVKGDLRYREQGTIRVHFQPGCDTLSLFD